MVKTHASWSSLPLVCWLIVVQCLLIHLVEVKGLPYNFSRNHKITSPVWIYVGRTFMYVDKYINIKFVRIKVVNTLPEQPVHSGTHRFTWKLVPWTSRFRSSIFTGDSRLISAILAIPCNFHPFWMGASCLISLAERRINKSFVRIQLDKFIESLQEVVCFATHWTMKLMHFNFEGKKYIVGYTFHGFHFSQPNVCITFTF